MGLEKQPLLLAEFFFNRPMKDWYWSPSSSDAWGNTIFISNQAFLGFELKTRIRGGATFTLVSRKEKTTNNSKPFNSLTMEITWDAPSPIPDPFAKPDTKTFGGKVQISGIKVSPIIDKPFYQIIFDDKEQPFLGAGDPFLSSFALNVTTSTEFVLKNGQFTLYVYEGINLLDGV